MFILPKKVSFRVLELLHPGFESQHILFFSPPKHFLNEKSTRINCSMNLETVGV
jgi:hypothetical protein